MVTTAGTCVCGMTMKPIGSCWCEKCIYEKRETIQSKRIKELEEQVKELQKNQLEILESIKNSGFK